MTTVAASIPVLRWAAQRARLHDEGLSERFRKWPLWLTGEAQPTLKQLEDFARLTHTAIGYFFLPESPVLALPIPDFRTLRDEVLREPSSELLDTLYLCQQRQDWYRDYARAQGLSPLEFVGSAQLQEAPQAVAQRMRVELRLSTEERQQLPTWTEALSQLITKAEDAGMMVMASSVVGSNSHRKLDVGEFRGFALTDNLAPLVFLNGADSKAAQMFTLAHELAHVWLGATGVSDLEIGQEVPKQQLELWCNQVAAELLMPLEELREAYQRGTPVPDEIQRLARKFKVSTLVALRRLLDAGFIDWANFRKYYGDEQAQLGLEQRGTGGGDFYRTLGARTGKRFAHAIVTSTLEGQTLFRDAFRMLGIRKTTTFHEVARKLGAMA